jgi:hypothetical protein
MAGATKPHHPSDAVGSPRRPARRRGDLTNPPGSSRIGLRSDLDTGAGRYAAPAAAGHRKPHARAVRRREGIRPPSSPVPRRPPYVCPALAGGLLVRTVPRRSGAGSLRSGVVRDGRRLPAGGGTTTSSPTSRAGDLPARRAGRRRAGLRRRRQAGGPGAGGRDDGRAVRCRPGRGAGPHGSARRRRAAVRGGFCIGGHLAFRAAFDPRIAATVCFYPTGLHNGALGADADADADRSPAPAASEAG